MSTPILSPALPSRGKKGKSEDVTDPCIFCKQECNEDKSDYPTDSRNKLKAVALEWKGLDKCGNVFESVNWDNGPSGSFFHTLCKTEFTSKRKLEQSRARKTKAETSALKSCNDSSSEDVSLSSKRLSCSTTGLLHNKDLCIWCMKPEDTKHPGRDRWCLLQQTDAWHTFKNHTVYLEDASMRDRILTVIANTTDPFAVEIRYHRSCWKKFISLIYHEDNISMPNIHLQSYVRLAEIHQLFLKHVHKVILDLNEPRTLQELLLDYNNILHNFGYDESSTKSSTIKQVIEKEFKNKIGFHDRFVKNTSTIVYNASAGESYIEAASNSWGVSDEQLLNTAVRELKGKLKGDASIDWPPHVKELEQDERPNDLLRKLLTWLKNPAANDFKIPQIYCHL